MADDLDLDIIGTVAIVWRANGADATADAIDTLVAEVRRLRVIVNELAIAYEDAIGCPPHISTGTVEPDRG